MKILAKNGAFVQFYMFWCNVTSILVVSLPRALRFLVKMFPAFEKTLSDGTLVAMRQRYFLEVSNSSGYCFFPIVNHQVIGHCFRSSNGDDKYLRISRSTQSCFPSLSLAFLLFLAILNAKFPQSSSLSS